MPTGRENEEVSLDSGSDVDSVDAAEEGEDDVRLQLVDSETGEPFLNEYGEPEILDPETSRILMEEAAKDGVTVEEKLIEVIEYGLAADEASQAQEAETDDKDNEEDNNKE